ncbi:polyprenyl synthetase family protein [Corynebacterium silvaticum]|uniref:Polyprenyl synthetase family protein n=1 Tax=Corynebacterium silvaticum TaxID=2320431 RepID=A0A7Y4LI93_9CORY|nr:polyprenyl synthetase family protein [Corynebacterium silvaticum]ARU45469.1 polyprenyl synthetase family protein [Corynebacterium silvaticum]MBH5300046.1 polyprenyl synthetase family protein [Corynebacterium silvaticum]NOM65429.1 polyprenyl synthetase family protein [Corynebacterium silvaticum]NON70586.1 polyprenyl synthetase family protein [Corynebacterium silvaticum]TFA92369.1 polyprenyl synthetase family protein [Corynebacterium silvaticum]
MSNGAEGLSTSTGTRVDLGNPALNEDISVGMTRVEELLQKELSVGEDFIVEKVKHLAKAGGKRFRPMFALLASQYGDRPVSEDVIKAAVVVEMTHLATLYHDDVMDEAAKRRGVESANARWNNSVAILAGDILLAHVSRLMADLGTDTVRHFSETFGDLVTGQMRETIGVGDGDPIEHYMAVIREKTGVLIASAGYLGALHSGASPAHIEALRAYGAAIGMVFQIVDDIIDIFSDSEDSGKTPGTDLREGVFTLPVLYALREQTPVGEELRATLTGPVTDDVTVARVLDLLAQSTGREQALADVHSYLSESESQLELLPQNATTDALRNLARFTVQRVG